MWRYIGIFRYDLKNVPEDGAGFYYGFKLKPEIQKEFDEMEEADREKRIEQDNQARFSFLLNLIGH